MSDNLKKLKQRIDAVKAASVFEKSDCAEAALDQAMVILADFETRLERLENGKA